MKPGTRCPINPIDFIDNMNTRHIIQCYDKNGISKGLLQLAQELQVNVRYKCKLSQLKSILIHHPAFKPVGISITRAAMLIFRINYEHSTMIGF